MGLLDSVIGALASGGQQARRPAGANAALLNAVLGLLAGGGLSRLVDQFRQGGQGDVIGSWISRGQNLPIGADQLGSVLGPDVLSQLAQQLGLSQGQAAEQMSQALPEVVDQLTPDGSIPDGGLEGIDEILGRFR